MLKGEVISPAKQNSDDLSKDIYDEEDKFISPFIYFFKNSVTAGLFKDLGDIKKLKDESPLYSSFIDQWMADAIRKKIISIKTDGIITVNCRNDRFYNFTGEDGAKKAKPIMDTITTQAIKQHNEDTKSLSIYNFFTIPDDPEMVSEYKQIVRDFYGKINTLSKKSPSKRVEKMHHICFSTCTSNKEDLNEI